MSPVRRVSLTRSLPLVGLLAGLASAEDLTKTLDTGEVHVEAPDLRFDAAGYLLAPHGFVARIDQRVLVGNALRYDRTNDDLYASGQVVLVMSGVRLHVDRLGMHPKAESGEGWNVEAFIEHQGRRLVLRAERVHLDRHELVFYGVHADGGHGGILGINASSAHVYLRDEPAKDRKGFERRVSGVSMVSPTASLAGIPVLWVPYVYRDFVLDYPWTRYEFGHSRRLGYYGRGWIGTNLLSIWDWHPWIELRGDAYSRTGEGYGTTARWNRPDMGAGRITWFDIPHEIVMGGASDTDNLEERHASVFDAEQKLHGLGGALYARYVSRPDADAPAAGVSGSGLPPDERFRADYLRDDLDHRPLARRGVTGVWGFSGGSLVLDTERRDHLDMQTTDRLWGAQVVVPDVELVGPFHLAADGWSESLEREFADTAALRTRYDSHLDAMQWLGPLGFDATAGIRGLDYRDSRIAGVDLNEPQHRLVPYTEAGVRLRFIGTFDNGTLHSLTPRVGIEILDKGHGDILPTYGFGDARDQLEEDHRYLVTGLDTSISHGSSLFRADVQARWALRESDHHYLDSTGLDQREDSRLVDIRARLLGSPIATLTLTGALDYDAQSDHWRHFDTSASWIATRHFQLRYSGNFSPATATTPDIWQQQPGFVAIANRYRFDGSVLLRSGGASIDGWHAELSRTMVDGTFTVHYSLLRNNAGEIYDQRIGFGFTMSLGGNVDPTRAVNDTSPTPAPAPGP